jgi:ABC-type uncharacterized transport system substrate-binding protein
MPARSRRELLRVSAVLAGAGLLSGCGATTFLGGRPAGPRRIGVLDLGNNPAPTFEPFYDGLRDLGYEVGRDILIEYRDAQGDAARLRRLADELVGLQVEVIVARDSGAAVPAGEATQTIPIVVAGGNVIASGIVKSITRPEGNITGVSTNSVETVGKWIELLKETVPTIARLAVVKHPESVSNRASLPMLERAGMDLRVQLAAYDVRGFEDLPLVLSTAKADGADGVLMLSNMVFGPGNDPRIGSEVLKLRLPALAEGRSFAVNGGLLAHGTVPGVLARQSARFVDKILKGAKPADLPIELPTEFAIVVNLKTAQELRIAVPPAVLARATEVIQ